MRIDTLGYDQLRARVADIARGVVLDEVDAVEDYQWPAHSLRALAAAGLYGLTTPARYGGLDMGLTGLVIAGEELGRVCASTALCFCMHLVGAAVIGAKPMDDQVERYVLPITRGEHLTTLALSEPGTGVHFYEPASRLVREGDVYRVYGEKSFVTNGGHADSYVVSTLSEQGAAAPGVFNCLVLDAGTPGMAWNGRWHGLGMRGNSSINLKLDGTRVPVHNLLGEEGDQNWYIFQVIAPYFLAAMAATYLGLAQSAVDFAIDHVKRRTHAHTGKALANVSTLQSRIADMWTAVQQAKLHLYHAAERADLGDPGVLPFILSAKASAAEVAVQVTNEAMTCVGGEGYRENHMLWIRLRDARASHVMSPTTDLLKSWTGKALLDLPLL